MKCFPLHKFISLVYILSGYTETVAFLTVGTPVMVMMAQLIHAALYSLTVDSDLLLLSRSYFLPVQRLSRHLSYFPVVHSSYPEIGSSHHFPYKEPEIDT